MIWLRTRRLVDCRCVVGTRTFVNIRAALVGRIRCLLCLTLAVIQTRFLVSQQQLHVVKITFIPNNLRGKIDILVRMLS
jgi:hypothetical protein